MAISFVGSLPAVGANNGGNVTLTFSNLRDAANAAVTLLEGDLVVCAYMSSGTADAAMSTSSSNWNELHENYANGTSNDTNLAVYWKIMGPSPDTSFVAVGPTGNSNATVGVAFAFRGVDSSSPIDVFTAGSHAVTGTATGRPNPATITPATAGAWIVAVGAAAAATGATFTNPGDLSATTNHFRSFSHAETIDGMLGMGIKTDWASGAFDPAAWTSGPNNAGDSWAAMTLALKPAPPTATCTPVDAFEGQSVDVPAIGAAVATASDDAFQAQAMDQPAIAPAFVVAVNGCAQAQGADASAVTTYAVAAPADAFQGQLADQPTIAPAIATVAADLAQDQGANAPAVTYSATAAPDSAFQGQGADQPATTPTATVAAADALQAQSSGQPVVASIAAAAPSDTFQAQGMDAPLIVPGVQAAAADAAQGQAMEAAAITPAVSAAPADLAQAQLAGAATVGAIASAVPADAVQDQGEDSPDVSGSGSGAAAPDGLAQDQVSASPAVAAHGAATVQDLLQGQTMERPIVLVPGQYPCPPARWATMKREPRSASGRRRTGRGATRNLPNRGAGP